MPVAMVDILAVPLRLLRECIQVLKWLVGIDKMVVRTASSHCKAQEPSVAWVHIQEMVAEKLCG